ncbi:DNA polymerase III subunit beta [Helicobacter mustelae]|uniref:Beta sliding clamp n=1 Tax=Helicobacter mustelae (strain ATCC 43772 / CCUG 25715 / CIP 103759 / LMG 18044 / NCTC 12198 / R85-136P) TaxID=679897 RepID=D3UFJ7_HELM1|nr:DNA polymerase III subunit beta [Helicobacter mustelae]CBG39268.1 DNA polymerase III, beta chain [Helicobacter mustelae 12198]SQH70778.1 DNA polymerase III subunit beta [Helicobacter mustelae]STP11902.1 DNA polymerase III subunit beta [Helicobacter mustelae]STP14146.1 DNA polymerase III subunit beta [Helicobacter mustelae]
MKFHVNKNHFEIILNHLQPFLDKKDSSQITSHIYLETKEEKLQLKATDYEIGLETKVDIKKEIDGNATVNGKKILEIVKRLKEGEITIETDSQNLHIKQGKSKFKLPMFDANEYPKNIVDKNITEIHFDTSSFIQSLKKITPAIDSTNQKPELTGALLEFKDYSFHFVATDTRRLALIKQDIQSIESFSIILPKKAISEISKLFSENIKIFYNETQLIIENEYYSFFTRLINGRFPDYQKILPKELKIQLQLPKDKVIEAIRLINSLSQKIKITLRESEVFFETISIENSEQAQTQFEYQTNIKEEISIGVDSRHILDFLAQIDTNIFEICINEVTTPFIVKSENFLTLILPIN